jgi:hypothetical protein
MEETLKLSDAIREGAKLRPRQSFGTYGSDISACAIGAARVAYTGSPYGYTPDSVRDILAAASSCPACDLGEGDALISNILHLNDDHKWTRERIADWVESIEATVN